MKDIDNLYNQNIWEYAYFNKDKIKKKIQNFKIKNVLIYLVVGGGSYILYLSRWFNHRSESKCLGFGKSIGETKDWIRHE